MSAAGHGPGRQHRPRFILHGTRLDLALSPAPDGLLRTEVCDAQRVAERSLRDTEHNWWSLGTPGSTIRIDLRWQVRSPRDSHVPRAAAVLALLHTRA